ncbi:hypothetical protein GCM10011579_084190 [Streptomyces albiflavescens]|uniref:Uncharacterized protein n=1 Tax=Streptomyces albiflavescens TaxID=1623582 RepID=A0A917YFM2_9ACTN|nr:hypothetical protein GCM10011579_084190 [Streptomyces albiflavescens]
MLSVSPLVVGLDTTVLLPGQAGAAVAHTAREAFATGLGPAKFTGAAIAAAGVDTALTLAPRRIESDDSGDQSCATYRKPPIPIRTGTGQLPLLNTHTDGDCWPCSASPSSC